MKLKHTLAAIVLVLNFAAPVAAGSYEDGQAAFQRRDYAAALRQWRPLAKQGDPRAQFNLGVIYYNGMGVRQSYVEAARWLRKAANQGHANSMHDLGLMYEHGKGVPQDFVEAHKWFNLYEATGRTFLAGQRDRIAKKMTPAQIAEAQKLARDWKPTKPPR